MNAIVKSLWVVTTVLQVAVLLFMTARKQYRDIPAMYVYMLVNLLQGFFLSFVYATKGYSSWFAYYAAWISQAVVVFMRWLAVCGVCRAILGPFRGIWALTWRILAVLGLAAMVTALALGKHDAARIINTFDLSLELSIASVLVGFFLFVRYYNVQIQPSLRSIGIAFCLYSSFRAFNDTFLQSFFRNYAATWGLVDQITYLATLILIAGAVYALQSHPRSRVNLFPRQTYAEFIPRANERLATLNDRLGQLLRSGTGSKA
jgi:hypothetical protein